MMRARFLLLLVLLVSGCTSMQPEDFKGTTPRFLPEQFFAGRTEAWGFFQDRFGKIRREFKVTIDGSVEGKVLTMTEHFFYRDGERQTRVWTITNLGDGHYEGRAGDIVGVAKGTAVGRALNWQYDFDLPTNGSTWRVHFDDWMLLQDENVMLNRSTVTKLGIELGEVVIFFRKDPGGDGSAPKGEAPADQPQGTAQ